MEKPRSLSVAFLLSTTRTLSGLRVASSHYPVTGNLPGISHDGKREGKCPTAHLIMRIRSRMIK